jgi:hypothetical protein
MTDDEPSSRETSGDTRIVIANGLDLDKRYFYEITKRMSRDGDLRKLSLLGPPLWLVLSILGLAFAVSGIVSWLRSAMVTSVVVVEQLELVSPWILAVSGLGLVVVAVFGAAIVGVFLAEVVDVDAIRENIRDVRAIGKFDIWQNLNYWHPFTSHLSDRDPIVPLSADSEAEVSSIYADGPHYQNVFVDALYVTPEGELTLTQRIAYRLYRWDHRRRTVRRGLYAVGLLAAAVFLSQVFGLIETPSIEGGATAVILLVVAAALVVIVMTVLAIDYPYLTLQFYSDSAGLSRYRQLLNDEKQGVSRGERIGLSNSMSGYGLFYISRFIATLFGRRRYDVAIDAAALAPGDGSEGSDGSDDGNATAFPASVEAYPGDEHATAAGAELLWSGLPAESLREPDRDPELTLRLSGVDYYTVEETGSGREELVKATAGERTGFRLPTKKFVSVRDGFEAETLRIPEQPRELLHSGEWSEDEVHTLFIGGGEHQQAINKLVLALKADGYRNIDVRENAFSVGGAASRTLTRRLREQWGELFSSRDGAAKRRNRRAMIHLPTEYFVSLVSGGEQFFRQDETRHGHGFLLFRHEFDGGDGSGEYAHVLIGMSAVGTKTGALFWQHLVENDFRFTVDGESSEEQRELEEDVVYFFDAPGPTDHPLCSDPTTDYGDIGDLYTDTSWRSRGLGFGIAELDEYDSIAGSAGDGGETAKRVGTEYYALQIEGVGHDS